MLPHAGTLASRTVRAGGFLLIAAGLFVTGASLWLAMHDLLPAPWFDSWMFVPDAELVLQGKYSLHDLLRQHNEHRIATARLFLLADTLLFAMTGRAVAIVNFGLCIGLGIALWLLWRGRDTRAAGAVPPVIAVIGLSCSMSQWYNLVEPFQIQFPLTCSCVIAAACLLVAATGQRGAGAWLYLAGALGAVLCAVFSMASGLLALPALFAVLWLRRARPALMAGFLAGSGMIVAAFETGYRQSAYPDAASFSLPSLWLLRTECAAGFLGSAVAARGYWPVLAGGICFSIFLVVTVLMLRDRIDSRIPVPGRLAASYGIAAWAVICGAACGVTRGMFGVTNAINSRYATVSLLFAACTAILAFGLLARKARARPYLPGAMLVTLAALLAMQNIGGETYGTLRTLHDGVARQAALLRQNIRVEGAFPMVLFLTIDSIAPDIAFLHAHHLSLFAPSADPPARVAHALADALADPLAQGAPSCRGAINAMFRIDRSRVAVRGWLADPHRSATAAWVGIGDEQGRVIDIVTPLESRPDLAALFGKKRPYLGFDTGFGGNLPPDPGRVLRFAAILQNGGICVLPGRFTPGAAPDPGAPGLGPTGEDNWARHAAAASRARGTDTEWAAIY
jgi:hypothetical protein